MIQVIRLSYFPFWEFRLKAFGAEFKNACLRNTIVTKCDIWPSHQRSRSTNIQDPHITNIRSFPQPLHLIAAANYYWLSRASHLPLITPGEKKMFWFLSTAPFVLFDPKNYLSGIPCESFIINLKNSCSTWKGSCSRRLDKGFDSLALLTLCQWDWWRSILWRFLFAGVGGL